MSPRIVKGPKGLLYLAASLVAFFYISVQDSTAQRTATGQYFISGHLSHDFTSINSFGGGVSVGSYLLNSYWKASIGIDNRITGLSNGGTMEYMHFYAAADWMYRLLCTHNRALSFYAGGGLFLGYEAYDPFRMLPSNIDTGLGGGSFLYGLRPGVELEYFFVKKFALTIGATLPLHFGSPTGWFKWTTSIGFRYNF